MPNDSMPKDSMPKDIMPNSSMPKRDYAKKKYAKRLYAKRQYAKRGLCQKTLCQMTVCQMTLCQNTGEPINHQHLCNILLFEKMSNALKFWKDIRKWFCVYFLEWGIFVKSRMRNEYHILAIIRRSLIEDPLD